MKVVVIGGTGLIGSQVVQRIAAAGHEASAASASTGVDVITGAGLTDALAGADVVVDVTNSPSFEDEPVLAFFRTSTANLLAAETAAGVGHHVILSIVGVDDVPSLGYYRAKVAQEALTKSGGIPYSIVRATQFHEFVPAIMAWTTDGDSVRLPTTELQTIASADVAAAVADAALGAPLNGVVDIAGPDRIRVDELGRMTIAAQGGAQTVVVDETAGMFAGIADGILTAPTDAVIASSRYADWLQQQS